MEIQHLKLLAARVRELLQKSNHDIGHNLSLDLIAAIPGLRNWPEVQAFPERVAAAELDETAAVRLAFRLNKKFNLGIPPVAVLELLNPAAAERAVLAPQIWPTGPAPGVYLTNSKDAVAALLERYEEATDGAVVYAERAGSGWPGSIDLGEGGLWSEGLERLPSGTLLIIGPVELDQQSWSEESGHLAMACRRAYESSHRVAVLVDTPAPWAMCDDVFLMVDSVRDDDLASEILTGVVTVDGELQKRVPFLGGRPRPGPIHHTATTEPIPRAALEPLRAALAQQKSGVVVVGSSIITDHPAAELVAAMLALTDHVGPAARIMPRHRSTSSKDWLVPEPIKQLPYLPSVQSAYENGYRRMIFQPSHTDSDVLLEYSQDCLLIGGCYGGEVTDYYTMLRHNSARIDEHELLTRIIALLGVTIPKDEPNGYSATDLYIRPADEIARLETFEEIHSFLRANRALRWEDAMAELLDSGRASAESLERVFQRNRHVKEFLEQRTAAQLVT
ncbi:MAG: hypothetical protein P4L83_11980 [Nevskia sp.]|nr:hypothetical protein [Nevskia sp.]